MTYWKTFIVVSLFMLCGFGCGQQDGAKVEPSVQRGTESVVGNRTLQKIGVQLYTLRAEMAVDFEGTLRKVAELGFDEVEFAGLYDRDPADVKALLDGLGLKTAASHVNWEKFRDDPDALIEETVALGAKYMIVAWLPEEERQTLDQWRGWIERFNEAGKRAREKGLIFAYHNHDFEFIEIDGVKPYDLILEGIDRRYVKLELDLFWIGLAGEDPRNYFGRYENGFPLVHVKDLRSSDKKMVDVGDGDIDFATIFAVAANKTGLQHYIVEHDNSDNPFRSIEKSLAYMRELQY